MDIAIDQRELRDVLGAFVTGVTVVATLDSMGRPFGCTVNSFSSLSLDPPLILWSQASKARSHSIFADAGHFSVNILAEDQLHISQLFSNERIANRFDEVQWNSGIAGIPIIKDCAARLQCRKVGAYPGGDHLIFIGQVEEYKRANRSPLVFGNGRYLATVDYASRAHPFLLY
jgi:flavin reductase (DIM6/NTAB) family NADH-FMN oxidoreductase RutF